MQEDPTARRVAGILAASAQLKHLVALGQSAQIARAGRTIAEALARGAKLLLFGNGGSAADAQHIAAEFVGRFTRERDPLPAVALTTDGSALTAIGNDYGFDKIFTRQVQALGRSGDVALALSTSGCSTNVLAALETARGRGMTTIGLTGSNGGVLAEKVDVPIVVPSAMTARIQECHATIGHILCEIAESLLCGDAAETTPVGVPPCAAIVGWDELLALRDRWRGERKTVVWTNGCFDLLHVGHVRGLQAARRLGDLLVVGLNTDETVRSLKGARRPIVPGPERAELLAALDCVDHVVFFEEPTPAQALARLQPDVHCKGADYAPPHGKPIPEAEVVESYGGRLAFLPLISDVSTTDLVDRIRHPDEPVEAGA